MVKKLWFKKHKTYEDFYIPLRYSTETWVEAGCPKVKLQVGKYWAYLCRHPQSKAFYFHFSCPQNRNDPKGSFMQAGVSGPRAIEFAIETGLLLPSKS